MADAHTVGGPGDGGVAAAGAAGAPGPDGTAVPAAGDTTGGRRRHDNPVQRDSATFLKTGAETGGESTLIEVEVAPGGGTPPHYHLSYSERFEVLQNELEVMVGGQTRTLRPGEAALVPPKTLHNFRNRTGAPTTFLVEMRPASPGFERALMAGYGLARDGLVRPDGRPRSLLHLALLMEWSDIRLPGAYGAAGPLFRFLARQARRRGMDRDLEARYCR